MADQNRNPSNQNRGQQGQGSQGSQKNPTEARQTQGNQGNQGDREEEPMGGTQRERSTATDRGQGGGRRNVRGQQGESLDRDTGIESDLDTGTEVDIEDEERGSDR